jgi:UDP-N-acetylmuramate--alanine ligase
VNLDSIKTVYFIGIGGIGMSALARFFKIRGCNVSGYDKTPTLLTEALINEGIPVHYNEDISQIPAQTNLAIYTPAIPAEHKELLYFLEKGVPLKKRSEVLGALSQNMFSIAVAGTHGKTTITGLISHIFKCRHLYQCIYWWYCEKLQIEPDNFRKSRGIYCRSR